jgi:hypothetical protein
MAIFEIIVSKITVARSAALRQKNVGRASLGSMAPGVEILVAR